MIKTIYTIENKTNKMRAINIVYLFHTRHGKRNLTNEAKFKKMDSWLFLMYFGNWNPLKISQNANHALILDHLRTINTWKLIEINKQIS